MILRVFLTGNRYLEKELTNAQISAFMAAYDNKSINRVELSDPDCCWHINKSHIIAIEIEPDAEEQTPPQHLLN
ncbi:MAG: hypothetical protein IJ545_06995 [Alphaproteobacteria bacterium]|nr:hypothetical protein [Alphaproteobacteria bacterium]